MRYALILLLSFYFISIANAQIDKEKFKEVFDEEINDSKYSKRENHSGAYQFTSPQNVPNWFVNIPVSQNNEIYSIGISDPEMDTTSALEMAIYRAQIMATIFEKSTTQLLCDFFKNEVSSSSDIVYEHFSRINAKMPLDFKYELVEVYRNSFDETIVLIKKEPKKRRKLKEYNRIILELFKNEIESASYGEIEAVYELIVKPNIVDVTSPMFYQLTEFGKRADVLSNTDSTSKKIPIYSLKYSGIPNSDSVEYCYFTHGLWKEYLKSVMMVILSKAREKPENIQYLTNSYNKNSLQNTTRGISVNRMGFVLYGIKASQNQIKVNLQEVPLK